MQQSITNISVDVLNVHPRHAEFFDDITGEEWDRFKESVRTSGVILPIVITNDMTILSGHQRWRACVELGVQSIPAIIRDDLNDEDARLRVLLAANIRSR